MKEKLTYERIIWLFVIGCLIGFGVGTIKIPTISSLPITKKIGGESIDEIIIRLFKFRVAKKKYAYFITKEGEK